MEFKSRKACIEHYQEQYPNLPRYMIEMALNYDLSEGATTNEKPLTGKQKRKQKQKQKQMPKRDTSMQDCIQCPLLQVTCVEICCSILSRRLSRRLSLSILSRRVTRRRESRASLASSLVSSCANSLLSCCTFWRSVVFCAFRSCEQCVRQCLPPVRSWPPLRTLISLW